MTWTGHQLGVFETEVDADLILIIETEVVADLLDILQK